MSAEPLQSLGYWRAAEGSVEIAVPVITAGYCFWRVKNIVEMPSMLLTHHIIAHKLSPGSAMGVNPLRLAFRRFLPTFPSQRLEFVTVTVGISEGP